MSLDPEHVKLIAEQAAWAALEKDRKDHDLRTEAAVARGMQAVFDKYGIMPEHLVWIRLQYQQEKDNWNIVRRVVFGTILVAVLTFGWNAGRDYLANKVLAPDNQRNGHQRQQATTEGP